MKQANTWRGVHLDKIISETCREAQSVNRDKYVRNLQKRKNSEACNLYSVLPPISAAWSNAIRCSQNSPCVAGCHLSKTSPHTGPRRNVVYKYKTKFPSSARRPQPKGLRWFGSWDRSAATVSDSGSILNRADRSWSAGRNRNQMWDLTAKTGSSEKPGGGAEAPLPGHCQASTWSLRGGGFKKGFRWGQMKTRDIKSATNMTAWREDANRREKEIRLLLSDPAGRSTPSTAAMSTKFHSSATNRELKRPSSCNVSSHRKKNKTIKHQQTFRRPFENKTVNHFNVHCSL